MTSELEHFAQLCGHPAAAYFYYADVAAVLLAMKQVPAQQICEFL